MTISMGEQIETNYFHAHCLHFEATLGLFMCSV